MAEGKVPPHSQEAETSIIGAILIDKDAIIAVAEFLRPEHFYNENHGAIFKAVLDLYEERSPIDIVTVGDKLKKIGLFRKSAVRLFWWSWPIVCPRPPMRKNTDKLLKTFILKDSLFLRPAGLPIRLLTKGIAPIKP